jgi:hypothetical protein
MESGSAASIPRSATRSRQWYGGWSSGRLADMADALVRLELVDAYLFDPMSRDGRNEIPPESEGSASDSARERLRAEAARLGAETSSSRHEQLTEPIADHVNRMARGDRELSDSGLDALAEAGTTGGRSWEQGGEGHSIFGVPPSEITEVFTIAASSGVAGLIVRSSTDLVRQWMQGRQSRTLRVKPSDGSEFEARSPDELRRVLAEVDAYHARVNASKAADRNADSDTGV